MENILEPFKIFEDWYKKNYPKNDFIFSEFRLFRIVFESSLPSTIFLKT